MGENSSNLFLVQFQFLKQINTKSIHIKYLKLILRYSLISLYEDTKCTSSWPLSYQIVDSNVGLTDTQIYVFSITNANQIISGKFYTDS